MTHEDQYKYLGVQIGIECQASDFESIADKLSENLLKINDSLLAPWQKLDAIRTFVQPCFTYALCSCSIPRSTLANYRRTLQSCMSNLPPPTLSRHCIPVLLKTCRWTCPPRPILRTTHPSHSSRPENAILIRPHGACHRPWPTNFQRLSLPSP